jgi:hypothetical protein
MFMSPKFGLALCVLLLSAAPAFAQSGGCGSVPFAPAMPTPADMKSKSAADAKAALHDAFADIKNWQGDLKTFRACLDGQGSQAKNALVGLDKTKDADKIKELKDQKQAADKQFDSSVDQEEGVVNEFHAAQASYCMRADSDKTVCPK